MIGIIGAMDQEIDDLKKEMKNPTVETKSSLDFWKGELCGKEVVLVRSGIGKVNATIASEILIETYKVDARLIRGLQDLWMPQSILETLYFQLMLFSMIWM